MARKVGFATAVVLGFCLDVKCPCIHVQLHDDDGAFASASLRRDEAHKIAAELQKFADGRNLQ